jgi:hypothetical protein
VSFPRLRLLGFLALVPLLPCHLLGAPLTLGQAVELALNRYGNPASQGPSETADDRAPKINGEPCAARLLDYLHLAAQLASANELGLPHGGPLFTVSSDNEPSGAFDLRSRRNVILCTALLYVKLDGIAAQQRVLSQQQEFANRLMDIESKRVHVDVDPSKLLTQAKLLRAKTRMESVALSTLERKTRSGLSALVGLSPEQIDPVGSSIPPLPENLNLTLENNEALQQLVAYRDIVQLEYISEYANRLKATQQSVLAKASIGTLVAAHITEDMQFNALLKINNHIRLAKIQFMGATDELENWALGRTAVTANRPSALEHPASAADAPALLSILIAPGLKDLQAGRSQQFSAIATFSNGRAQDVTSEAIWDCSSNTSAVVSTTGLLTGLSAGAITISVEFQGIRHSRNLSITEQPVDEYLLPDHRNTLP